MNLIIKLLHLIGNIFIYIAILLLTINFIGLFNYTSIDSSHPQANNPIESRYPRTLTEKEFWQKAYKSANETVEAYIPRVMKLINDRLIHVDSEQMKPTFFENWIMWRYANKKGWYEWTDTKKAIRAGGGFCSQHAIVLNNILREQDIESHIIGIHGHVLNEVKVNGNWRVYDPDYNVVFNHSLHELEQNPSLVSKTYLNSGWSDTTATTLEALFSTTEDNWYYKTSRSWGDKRAFKEGISIYLIWFIPALFTLLGILLRLSVKQIR